MTESECIKMLPIFPWILFSRPEEKHGHNTAESCWLCRLFRPLNWCYPQMLATIYHHKVSQDATTKVYKSSRSAVSTKLFWGYGYIAWTPKSGSEIGTSPWFWRSWPNATRLVSWKICRKPSIIRASPRFSHHWVEHGASAMMILRPPWTCQSG